MADGSVTIDTQLDNKGFEKGISALKNSANKALNALKTMAIAGAGAIATAYTGMITASVKARGEIEQQMGGTEAVFGEFAKQVQEQSVKAFSSMGMSANDYMATINKMGALMQGSGLSQQESLDLASQAMQRASDVASIMGIDVSDAMQAISGAAKGNFTMMDNLGVAMNATNIEAYALSKGIETSYKEMENSQKVQLAMQMFLEKSAYAAGNYAKENDTLAGSVNTLKGAWNNFLSGVGSINDVIETGKNALEIIVETAKTAISEINEQLLGLLTTALEPVKQWVIEHQNLLIVLAGIVGTLTAAIVAYTIATNASAIALGIYTTVTTVATTVSAAFGAIMAFLTSPITLVILAIGALVTAIVLLVKNWDTVKEKALEVWDKIKEGLKKAIDAIINWFKQLPYKIGYAIGELLGKIIKFGVDTMNWVRNDLPQIINNIINWFKELPGRIWNVLLQTIVNIGNWLINMKSKVSEGIRNVVDTIINFFRNLPSNMANIGQNIVEGLWNGIKNAGNWIKDKVKNFAKGILDGMKSALGIHSPSKVFEEQVGKNIALGVGGGFTKNIRGVYEKMQRAVNVETSKLSTGLTASSNINVMRNANITSTLDEINTDREITVNAITNLDGKVLTRTVNTVNARQRLAYGIGG